MKLFNVRISAENVVIIFVGVVLLVYLSYTFFTAAILSWFGILVYKDVTSIVTNIESFGTVKLLIFLMKSVVSLIYNGISLTAASR